MRAFFPGKKTSSLWSGRSAGFADSRTDSAPAPAPGPRETNARFYRKENIERVVQQAQTQTQTQRQQTDGEGEDEGEGVGDESTFRVLGTRECNLWDARDFHSAVRIVIGLSMYLMSGEAECGFLQKAFEHFPCLHGTGTETEPRIGTGTGTGIERLRQRAAREQMEAVLRERRKERHERKERARRRQRVFERSSAGDRRFGGFRDIRHRGWDWVWMDQQVDPSSEDEEDVILNSVCMSGRPD